VGRDIDGGGGGDLLQFDALGRPAVQSDTALRVTGFNPVALSRLNRVQYVNQSSVNIVSLVRMLRTTPLVYNSLSDTFTQTVIYRNDSNTMAFGGPFTLVIKGLPRGVGLINRTGNVPPRGEPFIRTNVPSGVLLPGQSFLVRLTFRMKPALTQAVRAGKFHYRTWSAVYAGPGRP
jgi:hypothetical protein